ncbi:MAG: helix-turn-helix domain-containing protein [Blastomonas fulva]|uniref:helix-turn-helix domain-containing protein n=1 Tax=Blastomonas fulva TaxID=1550728 RepID=UPI0024E1A6D0|nr:helix-turn-helix domain-containing protein [Blastomonas fulva]MDK2759092.1 helix-turn-helix domain-containing protein [Blastomonas fulva]
MADFLNSCKPLEPPPIIGKSSRHQPHCGTQTEATMDELAYSINRTAKVLGVGRSTIYKLIKTGQVDAIKIGTRTLITTTSITRLTQTRREV